MVYYYMYKTTNLLNGKIYIGVHKTENLADGYLGSGTLLKLAIAKHGEASFRRDILEYFDSAEAMFSREATIVDRDFVLREDNYNIALGGRWPGLDAVRFGRKVANEHGAMRKGGIATKRLGVGIFSTSSRALQLQWARSHANKVNLKAMHAKSLGESARLKRVATLRQIGHAQGAKNSQFGSMWITNEIENRKIGKEDSIPAGWKKGRRIKSARLAQK